MLYNITHLIYVITNEKYLICIVSNMHRGVSGYLKLGGQLVMRRATAAAPLPGGAFYSAKD